MIKTILLLFLPLFFLTGCNSGFLGVALESMTVSKVDGYFDLEREQRDELKKKIHEDFRVVRKSVLPDVANSLRQLDRQIKIEVSTPVDFTGVMFTARNSMKKAGGHFEKTAVQLSHQLSEDQFQYFKRKTEKDLSEAQEKTATAEGAFRQSFKNYEKYIQFWIGSLSETQKKMLGDFLKSHPYPWSLQNENKKMLLAKFMSSRSNPAELQKYLAEFFGDYESVRLPSFQKALQEHRQAFLNFLNESLWRELSSGQRKELKENLTARASKLEQLSSKD